MEWHDECYTFAETLERLDINEARLKQLVSEGEIRAFRQGDQMIFRKADVDHLALQPKLQEQPGVTREETLVDDLIFDEGDDLDLTSAEANLTAARAKANPPSPTPPPTIEELRQEIEELRRTHKDLLLRVQELEEWRHSIAIASGPVRA